VVRVTPESSPSDDDGVTGRTADAGALDDLSLFEEFHRTRSRSLRNRIVERHQGLAVHISRRYARSGAEDDIRQVAMLGLIRAVDRFDPTREVAFSSFAGRTIEGEIKRHFRDATWSARVPRSAKEMHLAVRNANEEMTSRTGRSPTVEELAAFLDVERDEVLMGLVAAGARRTSPLQPERSGDDPGEHREVAALATEEAGYERADERDQIGELLGRLDERSQRIVTLRFFEQLTQSEIAEREGISQMHVSRLLRRAFDDLRLAAEH
jgi:RNA polymerase sigma-B factor